METGTTKSAPAEDASESLVTMELAMVLDAKEMLTPSNAG